MPFVVSRENSSLGFLVLCSCFPLLKARGLTRISSFRGCLEAAISAKDTQSVLRACVLLDIRFNEIAGNS